MDRSSNKEFIQSSSSIKSSRFVNLKLVMDSVTISRTSNVSLVLTDDWNSIFIFLIPHGINLHFNGDPSSKNKFSYVSDNLGT